jgi:hypothetical protein
MPLSEDEERVFALLEAQLTAEDPKLATKMRTVSKPQIHGRRAALAGLIFAVGLVALIVGLRNHPAISVVGFVLMLVAALIGLKSWGYVEAEQEQPDEPIVVFPRR